MITTIIIPVATRQGANGTINEPATPPPAQYLKSYCDGVNYYYALTAEDIAALDLQFAPTTAQLLAEAIEKKKAAIDEKTAWGITIKGYAFNTFQFPFSIVDQINFTGLYGRKDKGLITITEFPVPIKRYLIVGETGNKYYSLQYAEVDALSLIQFNHVN